VQPPDSFSQGLGLVYKLGGAASAGGKNQFDNFVEWQRSLDTPLIAAIA
jgi:hypothetical protein